mgnify:CR=1 FL=1
MCWICDFKTPDAPTGPSAHSPWAPRRAFLLAAGAAAATAAASPALAQVDVGKASAMRQLVPAASLESSATKQYAQVLADARAKGALAPEHYPQLQRLRAIAARLIPYAGQWNPRAKAWQWEVNLIGSKQINAWCMPGGKIAFYTGILDQLKLTDDEVAMVMGHEMAHALREHARERMGKTAATRIGANVLSAVLGLGNLGDAALQMGAQLLTLKFGREDESEADLIGMDLSARAGYSPQAGVSLPNHFTVMQVLPGERIATPGTPRAISSHWMWRSLLTNDR